MLRVCQQFVHDNYAKQELSYRKQIARQLRTQFVEGISVTLKSTLRVIQETEPLDRSYTTYC